MFHDKLLVLGHQMFQGREQILKIVWIGIGPKRVANLSLDVRRVNVYFLQLMLDSDEFALALLFGANHEEMEVS